MAPTEKPTEQPAAAAEAALAKKEIPTPIAESLIKRQALAAEIDALKASLEKEAVTNTFAKNALARLTIAIKEGEKAMRTTLDDIYASPEFQGLQHATREHLNTLRSSIGTIVDTTVANMSPQAVSTIQKVWDYAKYPLSAIGAWQVGSLLWRGTKAVSGWVGKAWEKFWDLLKSGAKLGLAAGVGALGYMGIRSMYENSKEEKPKTA